MAYVHFHKVGHLRRDCRYQASTPNEEDTKGKGKVDVDEIHNQMGKMWKKKIEESGTSNVSVYDTSSNGLGDSPYTN